MDSNKENVTNHGPPRPNNLYSIRYPQTPERDSASHQNASFSGSFPSDHPPSTSKLLHDVLQQLDDQVESRKKELSELLKSRSANKARTGKKKYNVRFLCFILVLSDSLFFVFRCVFSVL
jgi:hypothetical protein